MRVLASKRTELLSSGKADEKTSPMIRELVVEAPELTSADLFLLQRRDKLKTELKRLEALLAPKIEQTCKARGEGVYALGSRQIELKANVRNTTSWAALATALIDPVTIDRVKGDYTVESTSYSAKLIERQS